MSADATIYVVDDDPSVRSAMDRLLRSAGYAVAAFETAEAFLAFELPEGPAALLLDLQMPGASGMDLQEALRERHSDLPIVFMTAHGDIPTSVRAMKGGAIDFLPKPVDGDEVLRVVAEAVRHHEAVRGDAAEQREFLERLDALTPREREVLELVVKGLLNKQIASALGISLETVKVHRGRVMRKSGVESLAELVRLWERCRT